MRNLPERRLYREENKVIAGVAAGLSRYLRIPLFLTRLLFLILLVAGPGLPLYVLCWILMPRDPADGYVVRRGMGLPRIFMMGVLGAIGLAMAGVGEGSSAAIFLFLMGFAFGLSFLSRNRREEEMVEVREDPIRIEFQDDVQTVTLGTAKKIAGVCAWISERSGMDVTLVRILTVILAFFTFPVVPILYLVGAFVVPKHEKLRIH